MSEPTSLVEAVDRLADRFRSMPQSRLLAAVPGHLSRSGAALALARQLAAAALALDGAGPREFPDAGAFAAGDQLAVAGHELAAALAVRTGRADGGDAGRGAVGGAVVLPLALGELAPGRPVDAPTVLAEALAAVAATADRCR